MTGFVIQLLLWGALYTALILFTVRMLRKKGTQKPRGPQGGDGEGGLPEPLPNIDLDLPPGVTLPDAGPQPAHTPEETLA